MFSRSEVRTALVSLHGDDKIKALKQNKGDYELKVVFSNEAKSEMIWWTENIMSSFNDVHSDHSKPDFVLFTDASLTGWGCSCENRSNRWSLGLYIAQSNINVLELKAALLALQSFVREKVNIHVRLMMDNTTAVACVSKMGTSHSVQYNVTKEIWQFCIKHNIWLPAAYIPGKTNIEADEEFRRENQDTEWI